MDESMLIIEAKDLAADKISKDDGKKKKHHHKKEEEEEETIEVSKIMELLEGWDDKDHEYYKDILELCKPTEDEEEYDD